MPTPQDKYYTRMLENLVKMNNRNIKILSNEKLWQAVSDVRKKLDAEYERNINKITCDASFQYPMKKKYVSTINNSVYYDLDEQVDIISDSNKQVDPRSDPMSETHIFDIVCNLSVGVRIFEPAIIGGRIGSVTNVLENLHVELSLYSLFLLNMNTSKASVIGSACKIVGVNSNILNCT